MRRLFEKTIVAVIAIAVVFHLFKVSRKMGFHQPGQDVFSDFLDWMTVAATAFALCNAVFQVWRESRNRNSNFSA